MPKGPGSNAQGPSALRDEFGRHFVDRVREVQLQFLESHCALQFLVNDLVAAGRISQDVRRDVEHFLALVVEVVLDGPGSGSTW